VGVVDDVTGFFVSLFDEVAVSFVGVATTDVTVTVLFICGAPVMCLFSLKIFLSSASLIQVLPTQSFLVDTLLNLPVVAVSTSVVKDFAKPLICADRSLIALTIGEISPM